jgi:hypothetical protein
LRIIDDALREDGDPHLAHELMLEEFAKLGAEGIDLYLFASVMQSMQTFNDQSGAPYKLNISAGSASFEIAQVWPRQPDAVRRTAQTRVGAGGYAVGPYSFCSAYRPAFIYRMESPTMWPVAASIV